MNGIAIKILRDGAEETVYLATHRSGEAGAALKQARRDFARAHRNYQDAVRRQLAASQKAGLIKDEDPDAAAKIDAIYAEAEQLGHQAETLHEGLLDTAETVVRRSLLGNYPGPEVDRIMDVLVDVQLLSLTRTIETGSVDGDFFPSPATPRKGSGGALPGDTPTASSSKPASPAGNLTLVK
jgi:ABC-type nitrate/sulfonate/bicarbonate transport system substrate-binding protein